MGLDRAPHLRQPHSCLPSRDGQLFPVPCLPLPGTQPDWLLPTWHSSGSPQNLLTLVFYDLPPHPIPLLQPDPWKGSAAKGAGITRKKTFKEVAKWVPWDFIPSPHFRGTGPAVVPQTAVIRSGPPPGRSGLCTHRMPSPLPCLQRSEDLCLAHGHCDGQACEGNYPVRLGDWPGPELRTAARETLQEGV